MFSFASDRLTECGASFLYRPLNVASKLEKSLYISCFLPRNGNCSNIYLRRWYRFCIRLVYAKFSDQSQFEVKQIQITCNAKLLQYSLRRPIKPLEVSYKETCITMALNKIAEFLPQRSSEYAGSEESWKSF